MNIVVLGMSNKTAGVDLREKFAFREESLSDALVALKRKEGVLECLILSTCNRVELYSLLDGGGPSLLSSFLQEYHGIPDDIGDNIYVHKNEDALRHLCRVAAGH